MWERGESKKTPEATYLIQNGFTAPSLHIKSRLQLRWQA